MRNVFTLLHEVFAIPPARPVEEHARRLVQQAISQCAREDREPMYRRDDGELAPWTDIGGES